MRFTDVNTILYGKTTADDRSCCLKKCHQRNRWLFI